MEFRLFYSVVRNKYSCEIPRGKTKGKKLSSNRFEKDFILNYFVKNLDDLTDVDQKSKINWLKQFILAMI